MNIVSYLLHTLTPPIITAVAIVIVGVWVNTTIRRKSQRDTVLVSYLVEQQKKINELIESSLSAKEINTCTSYLRGLSNEIHHLAELSNFLSPHKTKSELKIQRLKIMAFEFKQHLTESGGIATADTLERARQSGNQLRQFVLETHFSLCESKKNT